MSDFLITLKDIGRKVRFRNNITGTVVGYSETKEFPVVIRHHYGNEMHDYHADGTFLIGRTESEWDVVAWADECPSEIDRLKAENAELLEALKEIADTDPVDAALDPQRAVRIAYHTIAKFKGEEQ